MTPHQQQPAGSSPPAEHDPVRDMLQQTERALAQAVPPTETEASLAVLKQRLRREPTASVARAELRASRPALASSAHTRPQQTARTAPLGATALAEQWPAASTERSRARPSAPSTLDELWRSYKETGDERLREQLILHYSPL
ncbi:hypothetical protein ACIHFC_36495, partial [Streptomyces sp. NPDC052013]